MSYKITDYLTESPKKKDGVYKIVSDKIGCTYEIRKKKEGKQKRFVAIRTFSPHGTFDVSQEVINEATKERCIEVLAHDVEHNIVPRLIERAQSKSNPEDAAWIGEYLKKYGVKY